MSVWPWIVDDMKRVKPTRCYTMVYWTLWITQHVSGITMPIVRSLRLYRWSQRMAPHLGYGRLLVWCMDVGFWSVRLEGCFMLWNIPLMNVLNFTLQWSCYSSSSSTVTVLFLEFLWKIVLVAKYSSFMELHFKTSRSRIGGYGLGYSGSG